MKKEELFKTESKPKKEKKPATPEMLERMKVLREKSLQVRKAKAQAKKGNAPPPVVYAPAPVVQAPAPVQAPTPVQAPAPVQAVAPKVKRNYEEKMKEAEGRFKTMAEEYVQKYLTEHKKALDGHIERLKTKTAPKQVLETPKVQPVHQQPVHHQPVHQPVQQPVQQPEKTGYDYLRFSRKFAKY